MTDTTEPRVQLEAIEINSQTYDLILEKIATVSHPDSMKSEQLIRLNGNFIVFGENGKPFFWCVMNRAMLLEFYEIDPACWTSPLHREEFIPVFVKK